MSSVNMDSSFLPFQSLYLCISRLTVVARTSRTLLDRSNESRYPCLVPDFKGGNIQCFTL